MIVLDERFHGLEPANTAFSQPAHLPKLSIGFDGWPSSRWRAADAWPLGGKAHVAGRGDWQSSLSQKRNRRPMTMPTQLESLYRLRKEDLRKAGAVLADAFRDDPVWTKVFEGAARGDREMAAWYETPVRYCHKYGEVYATSSGLEGIAAWVPGDLADMTTGRMLRAGSLSANMRMGLRMARRAQSMRPVFDQLESDRKANMTGKAYIYIMIVGVASALQGQGHGGKLLRALLEESQRGRIPIYLETETEENVAFYQRLGFRVVRQIVLPIIGLPMWEMVSEPGT